MTTRERFRFLLKQLLTASQARVLPWEATPDENTLRAVFNKGLVHITRTNGHTSSPGEAVVQGPVVEASLFNQENALVAEFKPANDDETQLLQELYEAAFHSALNPDAVISDIEFEVHNRMRSGAK